MIQESLMDVVFPREISRWRASSPAFRARDRPGADNFVTNEDPSPGSPTA